MSKSEMIREYLKSHPYASNRQVIDAFNEKSIEITANLINQVRHDYKAKVVKQAELVTDEEPLLKVKKLADEVGGVDRLFQLVLLLKKLFGDEKGVKDGAQEEER